MTAGVVTLVQHSLPEGIKKRPTEVPLEGSLGVLGHLSSPYNLWPSERISGRVS